MEEEEDEPLENVWWVREGTDPEALRYQYEEKLRMIGDYKRMALVLVKSGERCLSFRLGPLQFFDSANFVKESLDTMIETRKKKSKKSMEETFQWLPLAILSSREFQQRGRMKFGLLSCESCLCRLSSFKDHKHGSGNLSGSKKPMTAPSRMRSAAMPPTKA